MTIDEIGREIDAWAGSYSAPGQCTWEEILAEMPGYAFEDLLSLAPCPEPADLQALGVRTADEVRTICEALWLRALKAAPDRAAED